jgi:uncharacterized protein with GYD domain
MPKFMILMNYTDQGIRNIKDAAQRTAENTKVFESMGGKVLGTYLAMGEYDIVSIGEAPSDEVGAAFLLKLGSQGNVRTKTLKLFSMDEAADVFGQV